MGISDPVWNCDDHMKERIGRTDREEMGPQAVFVDAISEAALVCAKRSREKTRLLEQPLRTAIAVVEAFGEQLLESIDALALAPQQVVEAQHLGHEAGADAERRRGAGRGGFHGRGVQNHLALAGRDTPWRRGEAPVKTVIEPVSSHQLRRRVLERTTK